LDQHAGALEKLFQQELTSFNEAVEAAGASAVTVPEFK
jgi:hypothetical protein